MMEVKGYFCFFTTVWPLTYNEWIFLFEEKMFCSQDLKFFVFQMDPKTAKSVT